MSDLTDEFMALFDGFREAHGTYTIPEDAKMGDGSEKVVGRAASINRPITRELWHEHLRGGVGLGVIPINAKSQAKFGAIDIDQYPLDLQELGRKVLESKLPLTVCRTKSGGAHLYLFTQEHVEASIIIGKLKEWAAQLGHGACEIYPRQSKIIAERGDVGNWINMPYHRADQTRRYALGDDQRPLSAKDFLRRAQGLSQTLDMLNGIKVTIADILPGGPPCLQRLVKQGFPQGSRNNGLFNLGVYAHKAHPGDWKLMVEGYNSNFMDPPLGATDVLAVIKSLGKKDYQYTCKAQPIQSYCDSIRCRMCKHGIGASGIGMPRMGTLTKVATEPPLWFLDVETSNGERRMELSTKQLQDPIYFQARCMEALNIMPPIVKRNEWQVVVSGLMESLTVVDVHEDGTPHGQFMQHLEDFCTSRVTAKIVDELLLGKPFIARREIHFRMSDFLRYLDRVKFNTYELNQLTMKIKHLKGARRDFHNIKGKGINVWVVPEETFSKQVMPFEVPVTDAGVL